MEPSARCRYSPAGLISRSTEGSMITRRKVTFALGTFAVLSALPAWAAPKSVMFDTDNDGTVDLAEAKKAASALFDKVDKDKDGTLDKRELHGRLSAKELAGDDPAQAGSLHKDKYFADVAP